ncbi:hypothetical protein ACFL0Q_08930 [Thermodesulfobacteriota bacterium]
MAHKTRHETAHKLKVFRDLFTGLTEVYGTYDPVSGRARQVKAPVTDKVLLAHLTGRQPYGVYLLVKDRTRSAAVDFDTQDPLPAAEFVATAKHYGIPGYIERSKSKGYHVWIFFVERGVLAAKARLVVRHILEEMDEFDTEVFPKQDSVDANVRYGHFINAPLYGALVPQGRTVFVDHRTFEPYPNQWDLLESVEKVDEALLHEILELNNLSTEPNHDDPDPCSQDKNNVRFSLPPCAQTMLRDGVSKYQRVSCFRLAVHLKRMGLPYDVAVAALKTWALKNRPADGKRVITENEIASQVSYAFSKGYRGFGCGSEAVIRFCHSNCPVDKGRRNAEGRVREAFE